MIEGSMEQYRGFFFDSSFPSKSDAAQSNDGPSATVSLASSSRDGSNSHSRAHSQRSQQMTPPLTPSASSEDLTPQAVPFRSQFHTYLRAHCPFHPPCEESSSTVTLPLNQGDIVLVHSVHFNGWADGTLLDSGHRGWLPTNYCEPYDFDHMRNLMNSLTRFYDFVREAHEGDISVLSKQDYTRGLVAGVRYLLEMTGCLNREAPRVSAQIGSGALRRCRKALLAELSALVKLTRNVEDCLRNGLEQHVRDCEYVDHMVNRAFKMVLRGVKFYDTWLDEIENERIVQAEFSLVGLSESVPPTPPADSTCFGPMVEVHEGDESRDATDTICRFPAAEVGFTLQRESSLSAANTRVQPPMHRSASQSVGSIRTTQTFRSRSRPTSLHTKRQSASHRISWSSKSNAARNSRLASERLVSAHENFLSFLEGFIGHNLWSRSSNEILVATGGTVHAGRALLTVVDAVWERGDCHSRPFQIIRDNMYSKIAELVHAAQFIFIPPTEEESDKDAFEPENRRRLEEAATDCVRLAGECVYSTRYALEVIGDFEFEVMETSPFEGVDLMSPTEAAKEEESSNNGFHEDQADHEVKEHDLTVKVPEGQQVTTTAIPKRSQSLPRLNTALLACEQGSSLALSTRASSRTSVHSLLPPLPLYTPTSSTDQCSVTLASPNASSSDLRSAVSRVDSIATTFVESIRCSDRGTTSVASTRATSPDTPGSRVGPCDLGNSFHGSQFTLDEVSEESEAMVMEKTFAHELMFNKDGQISGGTLPALVERLTTHDSTPNAQFVSTFWLTFRMFTTPVDFAHALIDRFHYVDERPGAAIPVKLRVYNTFKGWIESHWRMECDRQALDLISAFASNELAASLPAAGKRLAELTSKVSETNTPLVPRLISSMGKTNTSVAQYVPSDAPVPAPVLSKSQQNHLKSWKYGGTSISILDFDPLEIARQLTIKESRIFCSILPEELLGTEWTKKSGSIAVNVRAMSTLSTDLANLVADSVLESNDHSKRAKIIKQWVKIGSRCLDLKNYDSLMAIICSLNSTTILRLKRTWECLSSKTKATLEHLKATVDVSKNYSTLRGQLAGCMPPCIPFVGIYLTDLTFVDAGNQATRMLPGSSGAEHEAAMSVINFDKHVKTAKIISELQRFQVPYHLSEVPELQAWIQDQLVRVQSSEETSGESSVNKLYRRSCILEPREQAAVARSLSLHHFSSHQEQQQQQPPPVPALSISSSSSTVPPVPGVPATLATSTIKSLKEEGKFLGLVFKSSSSHKDVQTTTAS